jgi:RNA polymerase sigma factor (sigma-70 family)
MSASQPSRIAVGNGLNDYLRLIKRIPLLAPDEELHLAGIVQEWLNDANPSKALLRRGARATSRMGSANLRLVVLICLRYKNRIGALQLEMLDLLQSGNLGLIRAVERYDPKRGYKLSSYAFWWIREAVTRAMSETGNGIKIPRTILNLVYRADLLQASSDQALSTRVVACRLGEPEKRLENSMRIVRECRTTSFDKPVGTMSENTSLIDLIRDEQVLTLDDDYKWLYEHVQALNSRERHVLRLRYGEEKSHSYAEVGRSMGVTKDQAQSLERAALRKLRRRLTPVLNPCMA